MAGSSVVQYSFTKLADISEGRHNIIAVVKFFRPSQKTSGGGFSMFASLSEPSLNGDKFGVTFVNNNVERLPTVLNKYYE